MRRFDCVIRGATLYDGSGGAPRDADVGIDGDRIAAVGDLREAGGATILDGDGLALAPGFIDVHSHDDFAAVFHPEMGFKLQGGVTTVVVGNCGAAAAPWEAARHLTPFMPPDRTLPAWEGYRGYLRHLDGEPPGCNVAALIGHGTARAAVMGNAPRAPDARELARLLAIVEEALAAGCVGLSTGLIYEPGKWAVLDELVALTRPLHGTGALYATHMRDEGTGLLESVREAIAVGERAGVPVQISHHKAAGRDAWGLVRESLRLIEAAQARGVNVTADQYPYTAGSTLLAVALPESGAAGLSGSDPATIQIASAPGHPEWEGRTLADLAEASGRPPFEVARQILDTVGPGATAIFHMMDETDVQTVLRHPSTMIGSDGIPQLHARPHPRLYGTFARVLGHYARDLGVLPLAEAVHRMTGFPARKFGLHGRGTVTPGAVADLVLFDPGRIADRATYDDPQQPPAGITAVFVNGTRVVRDGTHTGARPGRALRRGDTTR